jgi:hypothetical protein
LIKAESRPQAHPSYRRAVAITREHSEIDEPAPKLDVIRGEHGARPGKKFAQRIVHSRSLHSRWRERLRSGGEHDKEIPCVGREQHAKRDSRRDREHGIALDGPGRTREWSDPFRFA